jgi:hypothetical protein
LFALAGFFILEVARILGILFLVKNMYYLVLTNIWLGYILGDSFSNSSGANPATVSFDASAVKIYDAASSLLRFEIKNIVFYFEKRSSLLQL